MPSPLQSHIQQMINRKKMAELDGEVLGGASATPSMPAPAEEEGGLGLGLGLDKVFADLNAKKGEYRDYLASMFGGPDPNKIKNARANDFHEESFEHFSKEIYPFVESATAPFTKPFGIEGVGEMLTRKIMNLGGDVNEAISGVLAIPAGRGYISEQGIDPGDLAANERGITKGLEYWRTKRAPNLGHGGMRTSG